MARLPAAIGLGNACILLVTLLVGRLRDVVGQSPIGNETAAMMALQGGLDGVSYQLQGFKPGNTLTEIRSAEVVMIGAVVESMLDEKNGRIGFDLMHGYSVYFQWLNRYRGGMNLSGKMHVVEVFYNSVGDRWSPMSSVLAADLLQGVGIKILLGPWDPELFEAAANLTNHTGQFLMSAGAAARESLENRPMVFSLNTRLEDRFDATLSALQQQGALSVAVLYEDTTFQTEACARAEAAIVRNGMRMVMHQRVQTTANNTIYRLLLNVVFLRGTDVLLGCLDRQACRRLVQVTEEMGVTLPALVLGDCVLEPSFGPDLGYPGEFVIGAVPNEPEMRPQPGGYLLKDELWDPAQLGFLSKATYDELAVPYHAVMGMTAAYTLARALEATFPPGRDFHKYDRHLGEKLAETFRSLSFDETPVGRIAFDSDGNRVGGSSMAVQLMRKGDQYNLARPDQHNELRFPAPLLAMKECLQPPMQLTYTKGYGVDPKNGKCERCPSGKLTMWDPRREVTVCKYCNAGSKPYRLEYDENLEFARDVTGTDVQTDEYVCFPCPPGWYGPSGSDCLFCPEGSYSDKIKSTACTLCPPGTFAAKEGSTKCTVCGSNAYARGENLILYSEFNGSTSCMECPDGALCPLTKDEKRTSMTNAEGFYLMRKQDSAPKVYRCRHGDNGSACLQNERCHRDDDGEEAMTGLFCGKCMPGYGKESSAGLCLKCPSTVMSLFSALLMGLILFLAASAMTILVLATDFSMPKNQAAIIIKIVWSYVQISSSVIPYITFWEFSIFAYLSEGFSMPFTTLNGFQSPWISVRGFSCISATVFPAIEDWKVLTVLGLSFIPMWMLMVLFFFGLICCWRRFVGHEPPARSTLVSIIVVNLFIIHPRANESLLAIFRCKKFDEMRMMQDTSVICGSEEHDVWTGINSAGLILYSLGIPCALFMLLVYHKSQNHLREDWLIRSLGFMYIGFEPQCYYFECLLMIRRILFPIVAAVPQAYGMDGHIKKVIDPEDWSASGDATWDLGTVVALLTLNVFFMAVHMVLQPFDNRSYFILDRIENASLWAITTMLISQAFSVASSNSLAITTLCTCLVIFQNARFVFLVSWGLGLRRYVQRLAEKKEWRFGRPPTVKVTQDGMEFHHIQGNTIAETSFATIFSEFVLHTLETQQSMSYRSIITILQRVCLSALQSRIQDQTSHGIIDHCRKVIELGHRAGIVSSSYHQHFSRKLDKGEKKLRALFVSSRRHTASSATLNRAGSLDSELSLERDPFEDWMTTGHGGMCSGRLQKRLDKVYGTRFTVEELHRALLVCLRRQTAGDFGDDAIATAMGVPTPEDLHTRKRTSEAQRQSQIAENLIKGGRKAIHLEPLHSLAGDASELRAERAAVREQLYALQLENNRMQAQIDALRHGQELDGDITPVWNSEARHSENGFHSDGDTAAGNALVSQSLDAPAVRRSRPAGRSRRSSVPPGPAGVVYSSENSLHKEASLDATLCLAEAAAYARQGSMDTMNSQASMGGGATSSHNLGATSTAYDFRSSIAEGPAAALPRVGPQRTGSADALDSAPGQRRGSVADVVLAAQIAKLDEEAHRAGEESNNLRGSMAKPAAAASSAGARHGHHGGARSSQAAPPVAEAPAAAAAAGARQSGRGSARGSQAAPPAEARQSARGSARSSSAPPEAPAPAAADAGARGSARGSQAAPEEAGASAAAVGVAAGAAGVAAGAAAGASASAQDSARGGDAAEASATARSNVSVEAKQLISDLELDIDSYRNTFYKSLGNLLPQSARPSSQADKKQGADSKTARSLT